MGTVERAATLLKYSYGGAVIILGLDKILGTNFIANWQGYVSEFALAALPVGADAIVLVLGIAEIVVGALMFTKWTRVAAIIIILTLLVIIINLLTMGMIDIAARDALIAIGALAYIWLLDARAVRTI